MMLLKNCFIEMSRYSLRSGVKNYIFFVMIFGTLSSVTFVHCFFVQHAYAGFDTKNLAHHFETKLEYTLTTYTDNYFTLHYLKSGGIGGNLNISNENITYDSKTNELSGICAGINHSFNKTLSDSGVRNLELMIDQNKELFTTNNVYSSQGADRYNHNLTVINDSGEHYSTWKSSLGIPASLTKIAEEIHGIACKN
jgi:hypothetical protein